MTTTAVRICFLSWSVLTIGLILAGPLVTIWLAQKWPCGKTTIPCWEFVAIVGMGGRGVVQALLSIVLFVALHRRMAQLGFHRIWAVGAASWLIGGMPVLLWTNNPLSVQFAPGVVFTPPIALLAMAMILSLFLCFARAGVSDAHRATVARAWLVAKLAALHLTLVLLGNIVTALTFVPFISELASFVALLIIGPHLPLRSLLTLGLPLGLVIWLDVVVFAVALAYLVFVQRPEESDTAPEGTPATASGRVVASANAIPRRPDRAEYGKRGT